MKGRYTSRQTYFGRNAPAIRHLQKVRKHEPTVAWVIGIGGGRWRTPFEHLEVALALRQGNPNLHVHALDIHPGPLQAARKNLEAAHAPFFAEDHAAGRPASRDFQYSRRTLGVRLTRNGLAIPEDLIPRITLHGPVKGNPEAGNPGDIFRIMPVQRPDVITCFNVSDKYRTEEQGRQLADHLADALTEDGLLLTDTYAVQKKNAWVTVNAAFIERLKERLGSPRELRHTAAEYVSPESILVFTKKSVQPKSEEKIRRPQQSVRR